ncbi:MAG: LPP20 family lipoprotein [Nitrospira sp.]|nr:LPP20 family lipoprotein [Nitrospira sp.]
MNQDKGNSSFPSRIPVRAWRRMNMVSIGIVALSLMQGVFVHPVQAGPLLKVLFGNDTCTFLPDRPAPGWVNKRPTTADFVGVGSAPRMPNPTDQIQVAEQNARTALAAEISVSVKDEMTQLMKQDQDVTMMQIESLTKQVVDQTLSGSRIEERYLDRQSCMVYALAMISKADVEEEKRKTLEKQRKMFKNKHLMLLDRSDVQGEVISVMRGQLEGLFKGVGNRLLTADNAHSVCADNPGQPLCQQPTDTIYVGYKMALEKEATTPEFKRRIYKLTGNVRFKDRLIASFDVSCQGTGKVSQDYLIDQQAAKTCFEKARPIIANGMEGSE